MEPWAEILCCTVQKDAAQANVVFKLSDSGLPWGLALL